MHPFQAILKFAGFGAVALGVLLLFPAIFLLNQQLDLFPVSIGFHDFVFNGEQVSESARIGSLFLASLLLVIAGLLIARRGSSPA